VAQDFFSDEVGRILTFDGSRYFTSGNDTLREVSDRFSKRKVAYHARVALANAEAIQYKQLTLPEGEHELTSVMKAGGQFKVIRPKVEDAKKEFAAALTDSPDKAAESLGHIDFKYYADRFSAWLADQGDKAAAAQVQDVLFDTLTKRKVLERVLNEIAGTRDSYMPAKAKAPRKPRKRKK
jgi:hypothetical protein